MKNIVILGSTGSIGQNVLKVIDNNPEYWNVLGLCCYSNTNLLLEQIERYKPAYAYVGSELSIKELSKKVKHRTEFIQDSEGLVTLSSLPEADLIVNALVGYIGLKPTIRAIETGKAIAIANKETLVSAGELILSLLKKKMVSLIPIDSEHSAIYALLKNCDLSTVRKIYITASGGPFWDQPNKDLSMVSIEEALNHPVWNMGQKVTIDSATMANKGLEVIEAHYLYGLDYEKIKVLIHKQSLIHAMIETIDGAILSHIAPADMLYPIHFALYYPEIVPNNYKGVDLIKQSPLSFEEPDLKRYPMLNLAYISGKKGGNAPCIYSCANEIAVKAFLSNQIQFSTIQNIVEQSLEKMDYIPSPSYEDLLFTIDKSRTLAESFIK